MSSFPFVKLSNELRINLFSITYIERIERGSWPDLPANVNTRVHFTDGKHVCLDDADAEKFLAFYDGVSEDLSVKKEAVPVGRDFTLGDDPISQS